MHSTFARGGCAMTARKRPIRCSAVHHRHMLEIESGIRPDLIATRGYRTVTVKAELKRLGFSDRQCLTPGLLLPIYLNGDIASYQFRPDQPQLNRDGKVTKYETPQGSTMILDVSPVIHDQLRDVGVPLLITEGLKKADAAISQGGAAWPCSASGTGAARTPRVPHECCRSSSAFPSGAGWSTSFSTPTCSRSCR